MRSLLSHGKKFAAWTLFNLGLLICMPVLANAEFPVPLKLGDDVGAPASGFLPQRFRSAATVRQSTPAVTTGRTIIFLKRPSVLQSIVDRSNPEPFVAAQALASIQAEQASAEQALKSLNTKVVRSIAKVGNALLVDREISFTDIQKVLGAEVEAAVPEPILHLELTESVPLIQAPEVWRRQDAGGLSVDGRGQKIAIIDSGIDYTHPAFGACARTTNINLGGCPKVSGGLDFIDRDLDPIDTFGHGTHVASIAAGIGGIPGVAPGATLLAYRTLGDDGTGPAFPLFEAFEASLDPNRDGNFQDHADIVNLSLGTSSGIESWVSTMIDTMVRYGITVVSAAGNAGPYEGIPEPGSASLSLTVGSSDKRDNLSSFSSRGPMVIQTSSGKTRWRLKPNVVAPGEGICAALSATYNIPQKVQPCAQGAFHLLSGTSMATPMVSGVAALVRQSHPDWDALQVHAAIRNSARLLPDHLLTESGLGRVDALGAVLSTTPFGVVTRRVEQDETGAFRFSLETLTDRVSFMRVEIAPARPVSQLESLSWTTVTEGVPQRDRTYYTLLASPASISQGQYYVRLSLKRDNGDQAHDYAVLESDSFPATNPLTGDVINSHDNLEVEFSNRYGAAIQGADLELSIDKGAWRSLGSATPVNGKLRATLSASVLPQAREQSFTVRLTVHTSMGDSYSLIEDLHVDPSLKSGFPVRVEWPDFCGSTVVSLTEPVAADLDGDGRSEIIVSRENGSGEVLLFDTRGSLIRSFALSALPGELPCGTSVSSAIISDLKWSGEKSVIIATSPFSSLPSHTDLHVLDQFGNERAGFPLTLPVLMFQPTILAADLNQDGEREILVSSVNTSNSTEVFLGTVLVSSSGKVLSIVDVSSGTGRNPHSSLLSFDGYSSPVVGDFDGDQLLEIGMADAIPREDAPNNSIASVFRPSGERLPGWPVLTEGYSLLPPTALDLNGNRKLDLIFPVNNRYDQRILALRGAAQRVRGWPYKFATETAMYSSVVPWQDAKGAARLVSYARQGIPSENRFVERVLAMHSNGTPDTTFQPNGPEDLPFAGEPLVVDVDGDRVPDLVVGGNRHRYPQARSMPGIYAFDVKGRLLPGFPMRTEEALGLVARNTLSAGDFDSDGNLDLLATSHVYASRPNWSFWQPLTFQKNRSVLYWFSLHAPFNPRYAPWPQYRGDSERTGCFGCGLSEKFVSTLSQRDSDFDGVQDWLDACRFDANKINPGLCGCGLSDEDSNNNQILDCSELPNQAALRRARVVRLPDGRFQITLPFRGAARYHLDLQNRRNGKIRSFASAHRRFTVRLRARSRWLVTYQVDISGIRQASRPSKGKRFRS